jgi:hypothetical protein
VEPGIHIDPPASVVRRLVDEVVAARAGLMMVHLRGVRSDRQLAAAMARVTHGHRTADAMLPTPDRRWRSALLVAHVDVKDSPAMIRRFGRGLPLLVDSWRTRGVDLAVLVQQDGVHGLLVGAIEDGRRSLGERAGLPWIGSDRVVPLRDGEVDPGDDHRDDVLPDREPAQVAR